MFMMEKTKEQTEREEKAKSEEIKKVKKKQPEQEEKVWGLSATERQERKNILSLRFLLKIAKLLANMIMNWRL